MAEPLDMLTANRLEAIARTRPSVGAPVKAAGGIERLCNENARLKRQIAQANAELVQLRATIAALRASLVHGDGT